MARSGVTFDEVKTVADSLSSRGERPTISRVKEELGGRGSTVAISAYLKQWRGGDELDDHKEKHSFEDKSAQVEPPVEKAIEKIQVWEEERKPLSLPTKPKVEPKVESFEQEKSEPQAVAQPLVESFSPAPSSLSEAPTIHRSERKHTEGDFNQPHHSPRNPEQNGRGERKPHFDRHKQGRNGGDRQQFRDRNDRGPRNNNGGQSHNSDTAYTQNTSSQHAGSSHEDRDNAIEKTTPVPFNYWSQYDYVFHGDLSEKSDRELEIIIRRMEALLAKEQSRRETAEKLFEETKEYASAIKKQIADRINELNLAHDAVVLELKAQSREVKLAAERDLMFYRDQLGRANQKIVELLKGVSVSDSGFSDQKEDPQDPINTQ